MPGTTTTQSLTYPVQGDTLRDHAGYLQTLAEQVQAKLNGHRHDVDLSTTPPAAIVRDQAERTYWYVDISPDGNSLMYSETLLDTASMVDLSEDNRLIRIRRPGVYAVGANVTCHHTGGSLSQIRLGVHVGTTPSRIYNTIWAQATETLTSEGNGVSTAYIERVTLNDQPVWATIAAFGTSLPGFIVVAKATLWWYWVRDL